MNESKNNRIIEWVLVNRQIIILLVVVLFVGGIISLFKMQKQEMPEYILQGLGGIFPGQQPSRWRNNLPNRSNAIFLPIRSKPRNYRHLNQRRKLLYFLSIWQ